MYHDFFMVRPADNKGYPIQVLSPKWLSSLLDNWGHSFGRTLEWCLGSYWGRAIVVSILPLFAFVLSGFFEEERSLFPEIWLFQNSIYEAIFPVSLLIFFTTLIPVIRAILVRPSSRLTLTLIWLWFLLPLPADFKTNLGITAQAATSLLFATVSLSFTRAFKWEARVAVHIYICIATFFLPGLLSDLMEGTYPRIAPFPFVHALLFSSIFLMHEVARLTPQIPGLNRLSHVLSPLHLVTPIPLSIASLPEVHKKPIDIPELNKSIQSFCQGLAALGIVSLLTKALDSSATGWGLLRGWHVYLIYLFFWLGVIRVGYAAALQLGYRLPPPTDFVILAVDPLSRWRRWNRYYYDWFLTYIFLPVSRLGNPRYLMILAGILTVFALNFFLHNSYWLNLLLFRRDLAGDSVWNVLGNEANFYSLHALTVLIGAIGRKYWPIEDRISGWWGVFITHVLMAATHSVIMR